MTIQDDLDQHFKVLLVEDDHVDIEIVRRHLKQVRKPRFSVESVNYLEEAIETLSNQAFDAVLLDLNLPDCNSLDSVQELKDAWPSGPIIVLTGLDEECLGVDAIRHGAGDYLVKDGLSATLLTRTISHSIERHRMAYWIKATEKSKDNYLLEVCNELKETLSELLIATSVLVGNDESIDSLEMQQIEKIMDCGKRMSQLIDEAKPKQTTQPVPCPS